MNPLLEEALPKKGNLGDIFIEFDKDWPLKELITILEDQDAQYCFEKFDYCGIMKIYIDESIKPKTRVGKKKNLPQTEFIISKSKQLNTSTNDILQKYLLQEEVPLARQTLAQTKQFLVLMYLTPALYTSLNQNEIEDIFLKQTESNVKMLLVLENVREWQKANELRMQLQKSKQILQEQMDLDNWLLHLQLNLGIDHINTVSKKSSMQVLFGCIGSTISAKYKKEFIRFQGKKQINQESAKLAGIKNIYQIEWMSMLMSIQGVSETKARAIVLKYSTISKLIKSYRECPKESRATMLSSVRVNKQIDDPNNPNQKKIGDALSEKIYRFFFSCDPNENIYIL